MQTSNHTATGRKDAQPVLCVFCGSACGGDRRHADAARRLGRACAQAGVELVTGGGAIGLMGEAADAALAGGGRVRGVIPDFLRQLEVAHPGLDEMRVAADMHERKRLMFAAADAFVALPGGIGTLDETVEVLTLRQLGLHDKPVMLFDRAYWAPLLALCDHMTAAGFLRPSSPPLYETVDEIGRVVRRTVDAADARRREGSPAPR